MKTFSATKLAIVLCSKSDTAKAFEENIFNAADKAKPSIARATNTSINVNPEE